MKKHSKEIYSSTKKPTQPSKTKRKGKKSTAKKVFSTIGKVFVCFVLIGVITVSITATALTVYVMKATETETDISLAKEEIQSTGITVVYAQNTESEEWEEIYRLSSGTKRIWLDIQDCPDNLKNAFVAIEDRQFYQHEGVNFTRTFLAFANTILHFWGSNQGASTITQQLVKMITQDNDISGARKIREIFRAMSLERSYSKDQILQAYLNLVPVGGMNGDYQGVSTAAKLYFNKEVSELTLAECASIAAIPNAPTYYEPIGNPEQNKTRRDIILEAMLEENMITQEQYDEAVATPVTVNQGTVSGNVDGKNYQSYFVDTVINEVIGDLMEQYGWDYDQAEAKVKSGGYSIYTTMDRTMQDKLEAYYLDSKTFGSKDIIAFNQQEAQQAEANSEYQANPYQSAMVIYDHHGAMKAVVGGIGEKPAGDRNSLNRAVQAQRQTGSSIKPLTAYGPAIEENLYHFSSLLNDEQISVETAQGTWTPQNYDGRFNGPVTLQYALERSLNIPAVKVVQQLTPQKSYDYLTNKLGFTDLDANDANLSPMSLGAFTKGVHLNELTNAFQIFGNGGTFTASHSYTKVLNSAGEEILTYDASSNQVLSEESATVMNRLLRQVIVGPNGTGTVASLDNIGIEVVGKTGTTNDDKDYTFVGVTPEYVGGVWVGFDTARDIKRFGGMYQPSKVWKIVMQDLMQGTKSNFDLSANVVQKSYCTESGLLAGPNCTSTKTGYYKQNNIPPTCTLNHAGTDDTTGQTGTAGEAA